MVSATYRSISSRSAGVFDRPAWSSAARNDCCTSPLSCTVVPAMSKTTSPMLLLATVVFPFCCGTWLFVGRSGMCRYRERALDAALREPHAGGHPDARGHGDDAGARQRILDEELRTGCRAIDALPALTQDRKSTRLN